MFSFQEKDGKQVLKQSKIFFNCNLFILVISYFKQLCFSLWPFGRGIYHNRNRDLVLWINESDHVIIKSIEKRGNVRMMTSRLRSFLKSISKHLKFVQEEKYGYLSVNPANIGAGLEVSIIARLPNLAKNYSKLKLLCENYDIVVRRQHQFFFELTSTKKLGLSEFQIIVTFFNGVKEIIEYERSLL